MTSERQEDPQLVTHLSEDLGLSSCTFYALVSLATWSLIHYPGHLSTDELGALLCRAHKAAVHSLLLLKKPSSSLSFDEVGL